METYGIEFLFNYDQGKNISIFANDLSQARNYLNSRDIYLYELMDVKLRSVESLYLNKKVIINSGPYRNMLGTITQIIPKDTIDTNMSFKVTFNRFHSNLYYRDQFNLVEVIP